MITMESRMSVVSHCSCKLRDYVINFTSVFMMVMKQVIVAFKQIQSPKWCGVFFARNQQKNLNKSQSHDHRSLQVVIKVSWFPSTTNTIM